MGIDCGGTNLKVALVKPGGEIFKWTLAPINFKQKEERALRDIAKAVLTFLKKNEVTQVERVGMGIAGDVDQVEGVVRFSPNLGWKNVRVSAPLCQALGMPVILDNDANCAAWGAYCLDAKRNCQNLLCLTLGTGVGGGVILGRKLYRGSTGSAGEFGHMSIQFNGRKCKCGNLGCLESMLGAWGLTLSAEEGMDRGLSPELLRLTANGKKKITPKLIARAAHRKDAFAVALWQESGEHLGAALANLVNLFNPDRIVLCGGVSKVGKLLLDPTRRELAKRAFLVPAKHVRLTISQYDERLGVVGAALLASQ